MPLPQGFTLEKEIKLPEGFQLEEPQQLDFKDVSPWRGLKKVEEIRKAPSPLERLTTSVKRKLAIFQKAGLEGLTLGNISLKDLPAFQDEGTFNKVATQVEPITTTEKLQSDITKFGYSLIPFYLAGRVVGWGEVGLTKPQIIIRTAGVGGILGGLEKPSKEKIEREGELKAREIGALKSAAIFGTITTGLIGAQKALSAYSQTHLKNVLSKATKTVEKITPKMEQLDTVGAYQVLQELSPYERNTVMNILKAKHQMPQQVYKGWFEKNIGEPVYNKLISTLEKVTPKTLKEKFIYRYAQPEEYVKLAEERIKNISLWQDKAQEAGKLVTEGVSLAESNIILRALREPTQLEILKTARPDLYQKALPVRDIIDKASQQLAGLKTLPEETRKTIIVNLESYVKRVYGVPEEKKGLFRFFMGRRAVREPRIYERGKPARLFYEEPLKKELNEIGREIQYIDDIGQIEGIGEIAKERLRRAGYGTLEKLSKANSWDINRNLGYIPDYTLPEEIRDIGLNIVSQADALTRYKIRLIQRQNEITNLIKKPPIKPDIPYEVRQKIGEITTAGYPVARSIQDIGYKIETARLFEQVAENPNFATNNLLRGKKLGWIQMPDSRGMGSLRNRWVNPEVAKDINGITKIIQASDRIYQNFLSAWKMGKVTFNPATHGRNILSNAILLEMSGVPSWRIPDLISASIDDIAKNTGLYQQFKQAGLGLGTFKSVEIEALKGVYSGKSNISEMLEKAGKGLDKTFAGDLNRLYQLEEEVFKLARGRYLLEQGFTVPNAFAEAEKWLFNYNKIPEFIRQVRTSPLGAPFITFQYKAMPRILEALIKRPMTVLKYPLLMGATEQYAIKKFNLTPEQVAIIKKGKPLTYILPFTDSQGNIRLFDLQYILPYGEVFERRYMMGIPTFGIMGNPIVSTPYNLFIHNRNPYTGQEIISEDASGVKKAKQAFQYIANQLLPPLTPGVGYPAETIRKAMEGRSDKYGIKYDYWWEVISNVAGLKTKPINIDIETWKRMKQSQWLWRSYDIKQKTLLKDMSLTDDEKIKQLKELEEERIRGFNKLWEGIITEPEEPKEPKLPKGFRLEQPKLPKGFELIPSR